MNCVLCGGPAWKVIYFGLPGRLCQCESCSSLTGLAAYAPIVVSDDESGLPAFKFAVYEGSYLKALLRWLVFGN